MKQQQMLYNQVKCDDDLFKIHLKLMSLKHPVKIKTNTQTNVLVCDRMRSELLQDKLINEKKRRFIILYYWS